MTSPHQHGNEQGAPGAQDIIELDVWSDIACPWCYIGSARLAQALESFDRSDRVRVRWRAFELDPDAQRGTGTREVDALMRSKGMSEDQVLHMFEQVRGVGAQDGLDLRFDRTVSANTFDAHRLVHLAGADTGRATRVQRALFRAHFTEGRAVDDLDELVAIGEAEGLDTAAVRADLQDRGAASAVEVSEDKLLAARYGITAVPFFLAGGKYAVSGAQPVAVMTKLLETAFDGPEE